MTRKAAIFSCDAVASLVTDIFISFLLFLASFLPIPSLPWDSIFNKALACKAIRLHETSTRALICQEAVGFQVRVNALRIRHGLSPVQRAWIQIPDKSQSSTKILPLEKPTSCSLGNRYTKEGRGVRRLWVSSSFKSQAKC